MQSSGEVRIYFRLTRTTACSTPSHVIHAIFFDIFKQSRYLPGTVVPVQVPETFG